MPDISNVLIINAGGGIGDAIQFLKLFKYLNTNLKVKKIYYFATDLDKHWFENKLKELKPKNVITIKSFPTHYGWNIKDIFYNPNIFKNFKIRKFDLIIDNQTKYRNTLVYKRIPHKYYISPTFNYFFCNPKINVNKEKHIQLRISNYLEKLFQKKLNYNLKYKIKKKYTHLANTILKKNKKYIGFSIKAWHPTRSKEFNIQEIIKVANYFQKKNYIPTFFLEEKYSDEINYLKKKVKDVFFPELVIKKKFRDPALVVALGKKMNFIVTIDNGVMHMLALSNVKMFCFFSKNSNKFKPIGNKINVYDCEKKEDSINNLSHKKIINFIENNI